MVLEYDLIANLVYTILLHKLKKKKKLKAGSPYNQAFKLLSSDGVQVS